MFPAKDRLTICFAHVAYQFQARFAARKTGIQGLGVRGREGLDRRIGEADALVVSGLWNNDIVAQAPKLKFIQSASAGVDQYSREALAAHGIRLASAQGVNARAVSEHAIALILALSRRLPEARDNQAKHFWRGMIGDLTQREDELGGKTLLIVGLGRIGGRRAQVRHAVGLPVLAAPREPRAARNRAHSLRGQAPPQGVC